MPLPAGILSLAIAGFVFVASHVLLSSTRLRGTLGEQLGERGFLAVYSLVALATFAWFVLAYSEAPRIVLWRPTRWTALVPVALMPLATILLVAGYTTPNPTAVGMERAARTDDPAPGILCVTRHPVLWAIGLWAGAHVVAAGTFAGAVFFAPIALLALGGTLLIDRKKRLALGSNWSHLAQVTSNLPFVALLARRTKIRWRQIGLLRLVAGLLLYIVLYRAHPLLTGLAVVIP
jgi:uncharacterized membrane protein